jgi:hypothetical protein
MSVLKWYFRKKNNILTCRPIARKRVDKHVSVEMDSWKPTGYGKHFLGYENEGYVYIDRFLETNRSLWDQQAFP